jgi:hypothetical protein
MEEEVKEYKYEAPSKKIRVPEMVRVWEESEAYQEYLGQKIKFAHFSTVLRIRDPVPF